MKSAFLTLLLWGLPVVLYAQANKYSAQRELRGSGRIVREDRTVAPFQAIDMSQFPADVRIDVGGTKSEVAIQLDDNFQSFLRIESVDGVLKLYFKDPDDKPFWISKESIEVTIKTPSLNRLRNGSNSDVMVTGLTGDSFELINQANGDVTLRGAVKQLRVTSEANGNVNARELVVQNASIMTRANATIDVNAKQVTSQKTAFSTIRNVAESGSRSTTQQIKTEVREEEVVTIILLNNSPAARTVTLRFTEPGNPTYGVVNTTLGPYGKRRETYPIGTKIEQLDKKQQKLAMTGGRVNGAPIVTLKADDAGKTFTLPD